MARKQRLHRDDWAKAALDAWAEEGMHAVAVEPVATRLGATKGSFYWHFSTRDDLVHAALVRWQARATDGVISELVPIQDPQERLRRLLRRALDEWPGARLDRAVLAATDSPLVQPIVRDVTIRRRNFMADTYREMGLPEKEAHSRAGLAYAAYVGLLSQRSILLEQAPVDLPSAVEVLLRVP
jgi:AcrR family transcriptional regulator